MKLKGNQNMKSLNPDQMVGFLKKSREEFTKEDIIRFIEEHNIQMLHFNYVGGNGRLKTLSFAISDESSLRRLLEYGERVDGSSLFSYIDPANSDLYVIPRFRTAFLNPFSLLPTLNIFCSCFDASGKELEIAPEYIVKKAYDVLKKKTGITLYAAGEIEYYVIFKNDELFSGTPQKNYHESPPFVKFEDIRNEALHLISSIGGKVKYGHAEVGNITLKDGRRFEQHEIEFLPEKLEDMADHIVIAKWVIRNVAAKYCVEVTFAPELSVGHAGNGLHIHIEARKDGKNVMLNDDGELSEVSKKILGGLLFLSPSLTAFGNTNPTSYLRLVPKQEAPTNICWGDKNRSVLARVPLGWRKNYNMCRIVNKNEPTDITPYESKQTVELRSPDGSANIHLLLAGMAVAAKYGLLNENSLKIAENLYVDVNIFKEKKVRKKLEKLPASCFESAEKLREQESIYLSDNVFSKRIIEGIEMELKAFNDKNLDRKKSDEYIQRFINCG